MDFLLFETRDHQRIEITHGVVSTSTNDVVQAGDHLLRLTTSTGVMQVVFSDEQWGRLVDCLAMTIERKH